MWPDLAKWHHFGKSLQIFGKFLKVYILLCKLLSLHWQIYDLLGLIFIASNGQILKNKLAIWSHWYICIDYQTTKSQSISPLSKTLKITFWHLSKMFFQLFEKWLNFCFLVVVDVTNFLFPFYSNSFRKCEQLFVAASFV